MMHYIGSTFYIIFKEMILLLRFWIKEIYIFE